MRRASEVLHKKQATEAEAKLVRNVQHDNPWREYGNSQTL